MALYESFDMYWARRKGLAQGVILARCVLLSYIKTVAGVKIRVICPRNETFVIFARRLGGRWKPKTTCWHFDRDKWDMILYTCRDIYGKENVKVDPEVITEKYHLK